MFYYYGRKKRIARFYPDPIHPVIIEPFAGSAAYSLFGERWRRKVLLFEKDPQVAAIWRWLIKEALSDDILSMPELEVGDRTSSFLHILHSASKRAFDYKSIKVTPNMACAWKASRKYMSENLFKIKHWEVFEASFEEAPDIEACWFVDPPYQGSPGTGYRFGSKLLDYENLARWVRFRKGQKIVCEGKGAEWLPFRELLVQKSSAGKLNTELIWTE